MYNVTTPPLNELPSGKALFRSTLIAAATAVVLLVIIVWPAEYGVDPTRIGRLLGLTEMGEIKMELAREAAVAEAAEVVAAEAPPPAAVAANEPASDSTANQAAAPVPNSHEVTITLEPGQGKEIKLAMREGASVNYSWTVAGGVVNYDTHADRPGLDYHGYAKGTAQPADEGVLVAAFDGMHGWFWRNRGTEPVTLTLRTRGDYSELRRLE
jgi:hypothetical protein